jgi:hypothetical protein
MNLQYTQSTDSFALAETGPVGRGNYQVRTGDCLSSIAYEFGFFWETIWKDPANRELRIARRDPNVLLPGDRLAIPEKRIVERSCITDQRHNFVRKGIPAKLALRFCDDGEPLSGEPYLLIVDTCARAGHLDEDGVLLERIPPNARHATISINEGAPIELQLGSLDPLSEPSGIQDRLRNLGFPTVSVKDEAGAAALHEAAQVFRQRHKLSSTGKVDGDFVEKLAVVHGA